MTKIAKIFFLLLFLQKTWAYYGQIGFYHFMPTAPFMLSRDRVSFEGQSQTQFAIKSFLEKRYFSDIYQENHFLFLPSFSFGFLRGGLGYYFQSMEVAELNYSQKVHDKAFYLGIKESNFLFDLYYISLEVYSFELAFLKKIFLPLEFNLKYQKKLDYFEGPVFRALFYIEEISGLGIGYEGKAQSIHFLAWLNPVEKIRIRGEFFLPSKLRPQYAFSFSIEYFLGKTSSEKIAKPKSESEKEKEDKNPEEPLKPLEEDHTPQNTSYQKPPSFAELIRLGVPAEEALKISQKANLCVAKKETLELLGARGKACY